MSPIRNSLRDFFYVIFKRKKFIFRMTGSIFIFTLIFTILKTPMYQATSKIYVRGAIYEEALFGERERNPAAYPTSPQRLNTEIAVITSWPVCEKVASLYGLHNRETENPTFRDYVKGWIKWPLKQAIRLIKSMLGAEEAKVNEAKKFRGAVASLQKKISAKPVPFSQVINIQYKDRDPDFAAQITNSITDEYLNRHLAVNISLGKSSFYKEQMNSIRQKLRLMEEQFSKFKSKEEIISYDDQERGMLYTITVYNNALTDVRKEIISQQNKLEKIRTYRRENPDKLIPSKEIAEDPLITQLSRELVNLKLKLADLTQKYTDENRMVIETKSQIQDYEKQIHEQVNKTLDLEVASLDKLLAEESALKSTVAELRAASLALPKMEITYKTMESNINQERLLLKSLQEKHEEALVEEAIDSRSRMVNVLEYATVPAKPGSPKPLLNLLLALIIGPIISLALVFTMEYFDHTINTPEDSEHYLNLEMLGSIEEV